METTHQACQVEVGDAGRDGQHQCLTRMCVQRSKIWSRCVRRGRRRQTNCLFCIAREVVAEEEPGEVVVEEGEAAGTLMVEAGGILPVEAVEGEEVAEAVEEEEVVDLAAEEVVGLAVAAVVVAEVVKEEVVVEGNVGEGDSREDCTDEFRRIVKTFEPMRNYILLKCYVTYRTIFYSNVVQQIFTFLFDFLQLFFQVYSMSEMDKCSKIDKC